MDRYPLVINPGTYPLTCQFSKYSKELVLVHDHGPQKYENVKGLAREPPILYGF
jgi:hypothetical protein